MSEVAQDYSGMAHICYSRKSLTFCCSTILFLISDFDTFVCLDDDEGGLSNTTTHILSGASRDNTSSSPHPPISSSQDWLSVKRRSHSFTSGSFTVNNLNDVPIHDL